MVWVAVSYDRVLWIKMCEQTVNIKYYKNDIMKPFLKGAPSTKQLKTTYTKNDYRYYQQDRATAHTSQESMKFFG